MTLKCTMILGDCLEVMPELPRSSVQMSFADLPYATQSKKHTSLPWDVPADIDAIWQCLEAVAQDDCAHVFTANLPLSSALYASKPSLFCHDLVYAKQIRTGFLSAERAPLKAHESILVFSAGKHTYNPQMLARQRQRSDRYGNKVSQCYALKHQGTRLSKELCYPSSIVSPRWEAARFTGTKRSLHPTQKPLALMDWLIKTYSNVGDHVLDPVSGSGTTACAALAAGRSVTCLERDEAYFEVAVERVQKTVCDSKLDHRIEVIR